MPTFLSKKRLFAWLMALWRCPTVPWNGARSTFLSLGMLKWR